MLSFRTVSLLLFALTLNLFMHSAELFAEKKPLKVFILAGQSNMEGHAKIETFGYLADDPKTVPILNEMVNKQGEPIVCEDVFISYYTGGGDNLGEGFGKLTAGYGARRNPTESGGKIGPEFTFGIYMQKALQEPILIIKTAWGGKSLFYDYRSPSSGVYQQTELDKEKNRRTPDKSGNYYRLMMSHVKHVLGDIKRVYPDYDPQQGYEVAGFVWFQGFNDMVTRDVYPILPPESKENRFAKYSKWMGNFIRDVRQELQTPEMPFIIGVMGVGGKIPEKVNEGNQQFRLAMAAPAKDPEFQKNVAAVQTSEFWDQPLADIREKLDQVKRKAYLLRKNEVEKGKMTKAEMQAELQKFEAEIISPEEKEMLTRGASNAGYHYLGCAKTFALMGKAYAETMLDLMNQSK